jgi:hypothetical protein
MIIKPFLYHGKCRGARKLAIYPPTIKAQTPVPLFDD